MPKISTYNTTSPKLDDKLIGTDTDSSNATKNFTIGDIIALVPGGSSSVQSLNSLVGALKLIGGNNINITTNGTDEIIISEIAGASGVESLNSLVGDLNVVAGNAGITVTTNGSNEIVITNAGTGGNYLEDVFVTGGVAQLGVILTVPEGAVSLTNNFAQQAKIIEVSFPSTLTSTSRESFSDNLLTEVDINNVTSVGDSSFRNNQYLNTLNLRSVQTIGVAAFDVTGVLSNGYDLVFPPTLTSVGASAFNRSKINSVTFDAANQVTNLQGSIFSNTSSFTSITLPSNLVTIGDQAFYNSDLTSIIVPNSVTSIGSRAFEGSPLTLAVINNGTIEDYAFQNITTLTSLTLNSGVTSIGTSSFRNLGITTVTIPSTVTSMGNAAFSFNYAITSAIINSTVIGITAFTNSPLLSTVTFSNNLLSIGNSAFITTGLTSITIPNTVTSLGTSSFEDTSLSSIVFDSVSQIIDIPQECFKDSWENTRIVTTLTLPEAVQTFGTQSFEKAGIQTLAIPNTTTTIGDGAFYGQRFTTFAGTDPALDWTDAIRRGLDTLTFDATSVVTTIGESAFVYNNISSLVIPASVTYIGTNAFRYNNLTSIILPATVTTVNNDAFSNNPNLTSVTINSTSSNISNAFDNIATTITTVNIGPGVTAASGIFTGSTGIGTLDIAVNAVTNSSSFDNLAIGTLTVDGTATINGGSFTNSTITLGTIGNGITLPVNAFNSVDFTTLNIGNNLVTGSSSFDDVTIGTMTIGTDAEIVTGTFDAQSTITGGLTIGANANIQSLAFLGVTLTGNFTIDPTWTLVQDSLDQMNVIGDLIVANNKVLPISVFSEGSIDGDLVLGTGVTLPDNCFFSTDITGDLTIPISTVFTGNEHFENASIGTVNIPNNFVLVDQMFSSVTVDTMTLGDSITVPNLTCITGTITNMTVGDNLIGTFINQRPQVTNMTFGSNNTLKTSTSAVYSNLTIGLNNTFESAAFYSNQITTLIMPAPVNISDTHQFNGSSFFQSNNISSLPAYFSSSFVNTLQSYIFYDNAFSGNITFPSNLTIFDSYCFGNNSLTGITNASPAYSVFFGDAVFSENNFTSIPDFLEGISTGILPSYTFRGNDFTSLTVDATNSPWLKKISTGCFQNNSLLTTLSFDAANTNHGSGFIGNLTFNNCNISSITFLATGTGSWNVNTINSNSNFKDNNLSTLPTGLFGTGSVVGQANINYEMFMDNSFSGSLTIPDGVTSIQVRAFKNNNLTAVSVAAGTFVASDAFDPGVTITFRP